MRKTLIAGLAAIALAGCTKETPVSTVYDTLEQPVRIERIDENAQVYTRVRGNHEQLSASVLVEYEGITVLKLSYTRVEDNEGRCIMQSTYDIGTYSHCGQDELFVYFDDSWCTGSPWEGNCRQQFSNAVLGLELIDEGCDGTFDIIRNGCGEGYEGTRQFIEEISGEEGITGVDNGLQVSIDFIDRAVNLNAHIQAWREWRGL